MASSPGWSPIRPPPRSWSRPTECRFPWTRRLGVPGDTFELTVTNTGTVTDTYNLTLGGPAALVSSLAQTTTMTLAPGASQTITITTGAVNFAAAGSFELMAIAASQTVPTVQSAATATLTIPSTSGLTATVRERSRGHPDPRHHVVPPGRR